MGDSAGKFWRWNNNVGTGLDTKLGKLRSSRLAVVTFRRAVA
jgi:hypothetical protein